MRKVHQKLTKGNAELTDELYPLIRVAPDLSHLLVTRDDHKKKEMDSSKDIKQIRDSSSLTVSPKRADAPQLINTEPESRSPKRPDYSSRGKNVQPSLKMKKAHKEHTQKVQRNFRSSSMITTTPSMQLIGNEISFHNDVRKEFRDIKLAIGQLKSQMLRLLQAFDNIKERLNQQPLIRWSILKIIAARLSSNFRSKTLKTS
nr:PREDICTED: uncharacterized protein LOC105269623 [Fopius arisanus]